MKWLVRVVSALIVLALLPPAAITIAGLTDDLAPTDVAVVLGNTVYSDGTPSDRLKGRLDRAVDIYEQGLTPRIIVSGGLGREGHDEPSVMAAYLISEGVPAEAIIKDPAGFNTRATAINTADLMAANGWKSVTAVTQFYHVPRTWLALRQEGLTEVRTAHAHYFEWRDLQGLVRETAAYAAYAFGYRA